MRARDSDWVGADPGGRDSFGFAILRADGSADTCCVDCVDEAIQVVLQHASSTPSGVGVDTPLWWSSGLSGGRQADQWLRDKYRFSGGQVQSANSLRGAALVQGAMFAQRVREHCPGVGVTETHSKAVRKALGMSWDEFTKWFSLDVEVTDEQETECDAVTSAAAADEESEGRWVNDNRSRRDLSVQGPSSFWLAPIHYFWSDE